MPTYLHLLMVGWVAQMIRRVGCDRLLSTRQWACSANSRAALPIAGLGPLTPFVDPSSPRKFLTSKPSFTAPVPRPDSYTKPGRYPSTYRVRYDAARDVYEVTLTDFK